MPYRVDARLSGRHPFQLFMLALTVLVSVPTLLGVAPRPGSIQDAYPGWPGYAWAVVLAVGSAMALVGVYLPDRATGLILEQLGLFCTGIGSLIYGAAALSSVGETAIYPVAIVWGYGVSCCIRGRQIQRILDQVHAVEKERGL